VKNVGRNDWRRTSKWWLPTALVLVVAMTVRLVTQNRSWDDALAALVMVAALVLLLSLIGLIASRLRARRLALLTDGWLEATCWQVSDGMVTRYLVIDASTVALVTRRGRIERSWARDQMRRAAVVQVANGFPSRPGLQLDFGHHRAHETIQLVFPRWLGLWSSREEALSAQRLLRQPVTLK
jgi:hypothetical protein